MMCHPGWGFEAVGTVFSYTDGQDLALSATLLFFQQSCVSLICSVSKALGLYLLSSYTFIFSLNLLHMTDFSLLVSHFKNNASQVPKKGAERGF